MTGSEDDLGASLITQMFDLWVDAELQRRGASRGDVFAALVELPPHGVPIVRINEEVVLAARASKDSGITSGTPVTSENIDSLEDVWPTNIGPDSGWTLFYLLGDAAQVAFDFRYNKGQANRLLDLARDYLLTSRTMVSTAIGPAVDSLYSAAELTVQVQMLSQAQRTRVHQARGGVVAGERGPRQHPAGLLRRPPTVEGGAGSCPLWRRDGHRHVGRDDGVHGHD